MDSDTDNEIKRLSSTEEGPFFERKSAFDRSFGRPKQRTAADIAWDIADTLSAMAISVRLCRAWFANFRARAGNASTTGLREPASGGLGYIFAWPPKDGGKEGGINPVRKRGDMRHLRKVCGATWLSHIHDIGQAGFKR